jgi:hypothetical protein
MGEFRFSVFRFPGMRVGPHHRTPGVPVERGRLAREIDPERRL